MNENDLGVMRYKDYLGFKKWFHTACRVEGAIVVWWSEIINYSRKITVR
jgi:hypothetical protein